MASLVSELSRSHAEARLASAYWCEIVLRDPRWRGLLFLLRLFHQNPEFLLDLRSEIIQEGSLLQTPRDTRRREEWWERRRRQLESQASPTLRFYSAVLRTNNGSTKPRQTLSCIPKPDIGNPVPTPPTSYGTKRRGLQNFHFCDVYVLLFLYFIVNDNLFIDFIHNKPSYYDYYYYFCLLIRYINFTDVT